MDTEIIPSSDLASQINAAHDACERAMQDAAISWALEAGRLLVEARSGPGKDSFVRWIQENCQFNRTSAYRYIDAYEYSLSHDVGQAEFKSLYGLYNAIRDERREESRAPATWAPEEKSPRVVASLQELIDRGETFGTIYADPPWRYSNKSTRSAADGEYPTMSLDEICAEPVERLASENSHLHLWTTNAFLFDAKRVIEEWGFEYKSCFVWVKPQVGIGNYWRVSHEFLLFGVRGSTPFRARDEKSWGQYNRGAHSAKPGDIRDKVEKVSPGPYLEMYGRTFSPMSSWTVYGNQVEKLLL